MLLLSVDTLSADHVSCYGYAERTTSVLDSLAAEGVRFAHCLVPQVWTLSSHMSLLTGLPPGVHRVGMDRPLAAGVPTLAGRLADAGFTTCGTYTSNYWLGSAFGFARGFASYKRRALGQDAGAAWVEDLAARGGAAAAPWFGFVHYMDPHSLPTTSLHPYRPLDRSWWRFPPERTADVPKHTRPLPPDDPFHGRVQTWDLARYDPGFLLGSYDDSVRYWDGARLRGLLARLRDAGLLEGTLLVITADHGEEFGEHGSFLHHQPHREVREVPLVMVWPGRLPAGAVVDARVSLLDVAPTLLDLAGLPPLPDATGVSLRPALEDPRTPLPVRDFLVDGDHRGYRQEATGLVARADGAWWLLKARGDTTGTTGTFEPARVAEVLGLFDLDADPLELHDLRAARPEVVRTLRTRLEARLAAEADLARRLLAGDEPEQAPVLTDEQKRGLKALGY